MSVRCVTRAGFADAMATNLVSHGEGAQGGGRPKTFLHSSSPFSFLVRDVLWEPSVPIQRPSVPIQRPSIPIEGPGGYRNRVQKTEEV